MKIVVAAVVVVVVALEIVAVVDEGRIGAGAGAEVERVALVDTAGSNATAVLRAVIAETNFVDHLRLSLHLPLPFLHVLVRIVVATAVVVVVVVVDPYVLGTILAVAAYVFHLHPVGDVVELVVLLHVAVGKGAIVVVAIDPAAVSAPRTKLNERSLTPIPIYIR